MATFMLADIALSDVSISNFSLDDTWPPLPNQIYC